MKTTVIIGLMAAALSSIASGAPCSGGSFSNATVTTSLFEAGFTPLGTQQVTCQAIAPGGQYITSITLNTSSDYTGGGALTVNTVQLLLGAITQGGGSSGVFGAWVPNGSPIVTSVGNGLGDIGNSAQNQNSVATLNNVSQGLTSLTFSFTPSSSVQAGTVSASSINTFFTITTAPIDQVGVPEPATLSLVGGALVALGLMARKRK